MELNQLQTIIKQYCGIDDEFELKTMLKYYHDIGVIVKHGQAVVLQALWLIDLFKQLITVRPFDKMVNNDTPQNSNSYSNSNSNSNNNNNNNNSNNNNHNNKLIIIINWTQ